jgi:hypothetical protein
MDLLRQSPPELRPFSPVRLDGAELHGVRIRREHRNIDILIDCDDPRFVIAIENKVDSREHSEQLTRYKKVVRETFGDVPAQFVYLTREGDEPSDEEWTTYTYRDIHDVLRRVRRTNEASIGDDVRTFLDHYLTLLGSRFMDDPKIEELCQRIYKHHRQALELIFEHGGLGTGRVVRTCEQVVTGDSRFRLIVRTPQRFRFIPTKWEKMLPPVGKEASAGPMNWLNLVLRTTKHECTVRCVMRPTSDADLRSRVIERLTHDPLEFGLKSFFKNSQHIGSQYATLGKETVLTWKTDEGPDEEKLISALTERLDHWHERLAGVPAALRPIIDAWNRENRS